MLLAIDVGNTNIEFGVYERGNPEVKARFRLGTDRDATSDEIGLLLSQFLILNGVQRRAIEDVIIASVVPQIMYSVNHAMQKYLEKTPFVVGENIPCNIENRYEHPGEVGADRLVNALAGFRKYGGPLIVVDYGTAITFDAVSADGAYLGGAIFPGIKISTEALFQKTAKLPRIELVDPGTVIGKTSISSIQAGITYGFVGVTEHICRHMKREMGGDPKVVATGGFSGMVGRNTGMFDYIDRTLTIDGLYMIYQEHMQQR